jgi:hypothetical protein
MNLLRDDALRHKIGTSMAMGIEEQLRAKLEKVEALYFGAGTAGERNAAEAAALRFKERLAEISCQDPPVEMQFSMPDPWAIRLFVALCQRYGLRPYRVSSPKTDDHYGPGAANLLRYRHLAAVLRSAHRSVAAF